jgi:glycosyltransferase EpsF
VTGAARVLHVLGSTNVGGAETMLMNLYRRVDRRRLQFDVVVYGKEPGHFDAEVEELGGRIIHLDHPRGRGLRRSVSDLRRVLRSDSYIAVHAHVLHASALAMKAAQLEGVPVRVAHSHSTGDVEGGRLRQLYMAWSRHVIRSSSSRLVACGEEAGTYLFGAGQPWELLRNGVDLERFAPSTEVRREHARVAVGVTDDRLVLLSVARFEPVKNHEFLIELARSLHSRGVMFKLLLAGEGSRRPAIEELVADLNLTECVSFLGLQSDVPQLLAAADGVLMPSHYEGIPVALIEAQASGVPCLVSDAVSQEVDLGVGLIDFLPLPPEEAWVDRVEDLRGRRARSGDIEEQVRSAGADVAEGVELLYRLYEVQP